MKNLVIFLAGLATGLSLIVSCGRNPQSGGAVVLADGSTLSADDIIAHLTTLDSQVAALQSTVDVLSGQNHLIGGYEIVDEFGGCSHAWGSGSCGTSSSAAGCSEGTKIKLTGDYSPSYTGPWLYGCRVP